jgi:hypothetical protein
MPSTADPQAMDPTMHPGLTGRRDSRAPAGRCYVGERGAAGCKVTVIDDAGEHPLRPRTPDLLWSFSWGRGGQSARELAWSILFDSAQDAGVADDWCPAFTADVITRLPHDHFCVAARDVLEWLHQSHCR